MKYMGSKGSLAKELLPIVLANHQKNQWYIEPFCGGCNMIDKVDGFRLANDIHTPLISLFVALQKGWQPPKRVSKSDYDNAKHLPDSDPLKGYIGFNSSYKGKYFGGYAGTTRIASGAFRHYDEEAYNNVQAQRVKLQNVRFMNGSYRQIPKTPPSTIYCDPPYRDVTGYTHEFDHDDFYAWCVQKHLEGHTVFVSEYQMPEAFTCVWEKKVSSSLRGSAKGSTEKLFTIYEEK